MDPDRLRAFAVSMSSAFACRIAAARSRIAAADACSAATFCVAADFPSSPAAARARRPIRAMIAAISVSSGWLVALMRHLIQQGQVVTMYYLISPAVTKQRLDFVAAPALDHLRVAAE